MKASDATGADARYAFQSRPNICTCVSPEAASATNHDQRDCEGRAVSSLTFFSRRDRSDAPRAELDHVVGKAGDVFTIVRHVHHGDSQLPAPSSQLPAQAMELGAQRCAKIWIEACAAGQRARS